MVKHASFLLLFALCGCEDGATPEVDPPEDSAPLVDLDPPDALLDAALPDAAPPDAALPDAACLTTEPWLTVNRIPKTMNGSAPFTNRDRLLEPYTLLLPPSGFTLDILGDPQHTLAFVEAACGEVDLQGQLTPAPDGWRATVTEPLPTGPTRCRFLAVPPCGQAPRSGTLAVEIAPLSPALDPFERDERWLLTLSRDTQGLTLGPDLNLSATPGSNGVADFDEALAVVGLSSDDSAPGAAALAVDGAVGASAVFKARLLRQLMTELRGFFGQGPDGERDADSVPIAFALEGEPGAPDLASFTPTGTLSLMAIGGGDPEDRNVGRAYLDWNNQGPQDNATDPTFGLFTTTLIALFLEHSAAEAVLGPFVPALGGLPVGQHPADAQILSPGFDRRTVSGEVATRAAILELAIELLGKGLASLCAHEMGHSLGLVPYGPPPSGLFAGEPNAEFVEGAATDAHINTPGFNLMQQGFTLADQGLALLTAEPSFNELNLAYLRRRLIVDPSRPRDPPQAE